MALTLGEARKDLSADTLFRSLRSHFGSLSDPRSGEIEIPLGDALMPAFSMFSLKDPSLLAFDDRRRDPNDNFRTIYGINRVPSDSHMRDILDPIDPADLRPGFRDVWVSSGPGGPRGLLPWGSRRSVLALSRIRLLIS